MVSSTHCSAARPHTIAWSALIAILALQACSDSTTPPPPPIITRVAVSVPRSLLGTGDSVTATATAFDSLGNAVPHALFSWNTNDATMASVDANGVVHALRAGTIQVQATATGPTESVKTTVSGTAALTLKQIVTRLAITMPDTVATGDTLQLSAKAYDGLGVEMPGVPVTWSTSDTLAVMVSSSGQLIGRAIGAATITATTTDSGGTSHQSSKLATVRMTLAQLAGGAYHNCGVARGGVVHCWGEGAWGRLGTGVSYGAWQFVTTPVAALVSQRFTSVDADEQQDSRSGHSCARAVNGTAYCWGSGAWGMLADGQHGEGIPPYANAFPAALAFGPVNQIATGAMHTCLLDAQGAAYCAGDDERDQIGTAATPDACTDGPCFTHMTAVQGGHTFASLVVGGYHNCGLTTAGDAWCWGMNSFGELGAGSRANTSPTPLQVTGVSFASLSAGSMHTCGLDNSGTAYCWGYDWFGMLGSGMSGSAGTRNTPVRVATLQQFASIYAGTYHSCALTSDGVAYCWGDNGHGQLGYSTNEMCGDTGTNTVIDPCATAPHAVDTQLRFVSMALGFFHTCGLTATGSVYCWGQNDHGQLGDGTTTDRPAPTRVRDTK